MNFNGSSPISSAGTDLSGGGSINGNLSITGDLSVNGKMNVTDDSTLANFTAVNGVVTDTLEVGTLVTDVVTEDPLIHLGKNNLTDTLNLGIFEEWNDGVKKYSGLIRSKDDKKQYLIEATTTEPNASQDITVLPKGDLILKNIVASDKLTADQFSINEWSLTPNGRFLQLNAAGTNQGSTNFAEKAGRIDLEKNSNIDIAEFRMGRSRGTYASPTALLNNDIISEIDFQGNDGSSQNNITTAFIQSKCIENWNAGARGSEISFYTTTPGTTTIDERFKIEAQGVTVQGNLDFGGTMTGPTVAANAVIFERPTNVGGEGLVWATTNDPSDGWFMGSEALTQNLILRNNAGASVLSTTQSGNLTILNDVTSKTQSTSGVKGSTKVDIDEPIISDTRLYQPGTAGIQESYTRGRGTPSAPSGLLTGDTVYTQAMLSKSNVSTGVCAAVVVKATTDHTVAHGSSYEIQTTNNGEIIPVTKFLINSDGVFIKDYSLTVEDGLEIGNGPTFYVLPTQRGVVNQKLTVTPNGQTDWTSSSYASMGFVDNFLGFNTDFTAKDEWVIINGNYQGDAVNDFSFQTNKLQYDGTSTKLFRVSAGASITKVLSGSAYCEMAIFVNNVEQTRSKQVQSTAPSNDFPQHIGSDCLVQIANNQLVDVRIRNIIDDESFRVIDLSVVITEV